MARLSRRDLLLSGAGAAAATLPRGAKASSRIRWDAVVVGAGAFGAWTARRLKDRYRSVLLVDAWGPAHARASSGGESRMTRGAYGADALYTRMAWESLPEWRALSARAGLPVFHPTGVLFVFPDRQPYLEQTLATYRQLGLPIDLYGGATLRQRAPAMAFAQDDVALFEPGFGALMARRAVQTLVAEFVAAGGHYQASPVAPPASAADRLEEVATADGRRIAAERFVFACGAWLPRVFPEILAGRIFPTRQEVFFFVPPPGDARFQPGGLPGWADFNQGDIYYGFPDLEARGFKIAHDAHGPPIDPDAGDRTPSGGALADVRAFMARRFPAMADRPLNEARVCQYENSSNGDFLIDVHPRWRNVVLVGAGSGHGFKHAPAIGRYAADLAAGALARVVPRFSLATKAASQRRDVH